jgi:alpha-beta hydrolase superfamily lysophospholipase
MSEAEQTNVITKDIYFASGDEELKGTLHLPKDASDPPLIVGAHGMFSTGSSPKQISLAATCAAQGIAYFRFDHRGCGESSGIFGDVTSLDSRRQDIMAAIAAIRETGDVGDGLGLFGSSLGGAAVLSVALAAAAASIITYAAPLTGDKIVTLLKEQTADQGPPAVDPERLHFDISSEVDGIKNILILHGDSDKVISPSEAHRIYQKAKMPKRLILLRDGDHPMSLPENQEKFNREATLWFKATLL